MKTETTNNNSLKSIVLAGLNITVMLDESLRTKDNNFSDVAIVLAKKWSKDAKVFIDSNKITDLKIHTVGGDITLPSLITVKQTIELSVAKIQAKQAQAKLDAANKIINKF